MSTMKNAPAHDRGEVHPSTVIVAEPSPADKAFTTLQARAALAGWQLHKHGRFYTLHRWCRAIDCCDLDAVRAALKRAGVQV